MAITETERLLFRHFHIFDADVMEDVFGDAEVMRFGDGVQNREWIENWLRRCLEQYYSDWGFGPWAVVEKETQKLIGYCGLFYFPDICGSPEVEVGYRLVRRKWGQGFATEAASVVRDYAFEKLSLQRLIALIDPENTASIRVAEKLGMIYEKDYMPPEYDYPDRVYAVKSNSFR